MTGPDQTTLRRALLDPGAPVPDGLSDGRSHPAGRRFNVYRNNVAVSLTAALAEGFPTIARLLGDENMTGLAGLYLRAHPPRDPMMMHFGVDLPTFLETLPQVAHLGYLPDIARLELALRRSYHAADATAIDPAELGRVAEADLPRLVFGIAPAVQVVASAWPIHDIWAFNMADGPKPRALPQGVLITRPQFDPAPQLLPEGGAGFVTALAFGLTLGAALEETPDSFDLGAALGLLLAGGAITFLQLKDP